VLTRSLHDVQPDEANKGDENMTTFTLTCPDTGFSLNLTSKDLTRLRNALQFYVTENSREYDGHGGLLDRVNAFRSNNNAALAEPVPTRQELRDIITF
jgi:hypothetical protein